MKINIQYEVMTSVELTIERDQLPDSPQELLESITRDELSEAPCDIYPIEWGHLKDAWRNATPDNTYITNEDGHDIYN